MNKKNNWLNILSLSFIIIWLILASVPFLWTLWGSFKVEADFSQSKTGVTLFLCLDLGDWGNIYFKWIQRSLDSGRILESCLKYWYCDFYEQSLTLGTLGGYALARSGFRYAFWILIAALIFRAMPHITLVSGYLLPFFELGLWGHLSTTIVVLVAINQPFTLWMLHHFFFNNPKRS